MPHRNGRRAAEPHWLAEYLGQWLLVIAGLLLITVPLVPPVHRLVYRCEEQPANTLYVFKGAIFGLRQQRVESIYYRAFEEGLPVEPELVEVFDRLPTVEPFPTFDPKQIHHAEVIWCKARGLAYVLYVPFSLVGEDEFVGLAGRSPEEYAGLTGFATMFVDQTDTRLNYAQALRLIDRFVQPNAAVLPGVSANDLLVWTMARSRLHLASLKRNPLNWLVAFLGLFLLSGAWSWRSHRIRGSYVAALRRWYSVSLMRGPPPPLIRSLFAVNPARVYAEYQVRFEWWVERRCAAARAAAQRASEADRRHAQEERLLRVLEAVRNGVNGAVITPEVLALFNRAGSAALSLPERWTTLEQAQTVLLPAVRPPRSGGRGRHPRRPVDREALRPPVNNKPGARTFRSRKRLEEIEGGRRHHPHRQHAPSGTAPVTPDTRAKSR